MRDGLELLPQLSIGVSRIEERVDGDPIKEDSWEELAGRLAHVSADTADLVRGLYLLDADAMRRTRDRLRTQRCVEGLPEGLRDALVTETLHAFCAMRPCRMCRGTGRVRIPARRVMDDRGQWWRYKARIELCGSCRGDGFDHLRAAHVQLAMKVGAEVWDALLAEPFPILYFWLRSRHDEARVTLAKAE